MPVPTTAADLSTTAGSNSPAGTDAIGTSLDDYLRSIQAILKQENASGTDITAAASITIPSAGKYFVVTGATGITAIADAWTGRTVELKFSSTPILTHSAGLILPGAANITAAAGDSMIVVNESTGVWRCLNYTRAADAPGAATSLTTTSTAQVANLNASLLAGLTTTQLTTLTTAQVTALGTAQVLALSVAIASALKSATTTVNVSSATAPSNGQVLTATGSTAATWQTPAGSTLGTPVASTSGTAITFTGIPSTAKFITINLSNVSTSGTNNLVLQLGDAGGIENTGYNYVVVNTSTGSTDGTGATYSSFVLTRTNSAASHWNGQITLCMESASANTWTVKSAMHNIDTGILHISAGLKSTSAALDRVSISSDGGADTFDSGEINICYV